MALYTFDENNIVKSSAVDKNGYHRDGGNVFVEDVFPMRGDLDSYVPGNSQFHVGAILNTDNHKNIRGTQWGSTYLYFGEIIDDDEFEIDLNTSTKIANENNFDLFMFPSYSRNRIYNNYWYISGVFSVGTVLPENWKELKAHLVVTFQRKDENNQLIEGEYGCFQIHQR